MEVVKPLYGIAEAGTHWWATYNNHHRKNLQMETSSFDPCLLISIPGSTSIGIVGMQTDDTIGLSDDGFDQDEDKELQKAAFVAKPKQRLSTEQPLIFNGGIISLIDTKATSQSTERLATNTSCPIQNSHLGCLSLRQKDQGKAIQLVDSQKADYRQQYAEQRARGAYIASICQPEACFDLSVAAQNQEPDAAAVKALNRRLLWQKQSLSRGLIFRPLDLKDLKLFVFVDGSFANNHDLTSQLGYLVILANETMGTSDTFQLVGNLIHYSSTKSKRITRSVLASEVYGMVAGVDMAYAISTTLRQITNRLGIPPVQTVVCTDSYSLYECLVKLGTTKEKRLMIDIMALRQSYERRELHEIRWIHGDDNPADALTKASPNKTLERFISSGTATIRMEGWVTRT
jgi:hypothetical protein